MMDQERYFPNHKLERDVGLAEYALAGERLAVDEQALNWSRSTALIISSAISFISFKVSEYQSSLNELGVSSRGIKISVLLLSIAIGLASVVHISNLIKSKVFAERKIIVLRRMLGVSYGQNTLVLPNWRLEGADEPFSIRMFPGYISSKSFPIYIIILSMLFGCFFLTSSLHSYLLDHFPRFYSSSHSSLTRIISLAVILISLYLYRSTLRDTHDNVLLSFARLSSRVVGIPISKNIEHKVYRVKLDVAEAQRVKADFRFMREMAIFIEDKQFYRHHGISFKGLLRAVLGRVSGKRNLGGGSTITQQFVRSNFITQLHPPYRRKFVEIFLAIWAETKLDKSTIMDGYLCTARFDREIYGFHRACRHFFGKDATNVSEVESFFLTERLGNIRAGFLGKRILQLLKSALNESKLDEAQVVEVINIYRTQLISGKISYLDGDIDADNILSRLGIKTFRQKLLDDLADLPNRQSFDKGAP